MDGSNVLECVTKCMYIAFCLKGSLSWKNHLLSICISEYISTNIQKIKSQVTFPQLIILMLAWVPYNNFQKLVLYTILAGIGRMRRKCFVCFLFLRLSFIFMCTFENKFSCNIKTNFICIKLRMHTNF